MAQISVVIPCYNAVRYVGATLQSVLAQRGVDIEIIVIDDGSSDGSADFIRREFPSVRVIEQANQGVATARNRGMREATAAWVAFVDADDIWLPGKLEAQWALKTARPDVKLIYGAWQTWPSQTPSPPPELIAALMADAETQDRWRGAQGWIYPELLLDCVVWTSTVLADRGWLLGLGGFNTELRIGEDYDLWLRASRESEILRLSRPTALYRLHASSTTRSVPSINHRASVVERALQRWGYAGPDGRLADVVAVQRMLARSWADFGGAHLQAGNLQQARDAAVRSLKRDPWSWLALKVWIRARLRAVSA